VVFGEIIIPMGGEREDQGKGTAAQAETILPVVDNAVDNEASKREVDAWAESFRPELENLCYSLREVDGAAEITPSALSEGEDDRDFPYLSPEEQEALLRMVYGVVRFNPEKSEIVCRYKSGAPREGAVWSGEAEVVVYKTGRSRREKIFLHKVTYPDGRTGYILAPKDFRL